MNSADMQGAVAQEVNDRLSKATRELKEKYDRGEGGQDVSVDGPSGTAYKEKAVKEQQARKERKAKNAATKSVEQTGDDADGEEEEEEAGDGDEDAEVRRIREQRLRQMKIAHKEKLENLGKGHGQYREVTQDEFIAEMTNSTRVICHFYHREFPRCKVMDHHLYKLAQTHVEAKFVKIDGEKTPFFVEKLIIRSLPTVCIFIDGVCIDKIIGFDGLTAGLAPGKEDEWKTATLARLLASKGAINKNAIIDEEGIEAANKAKYEELRKSAFVNSISNFDDDDDLNLSD